MPKLITDFFTVATSGPTIDGRVIKADWLRDMAETYNAKTYIGKIWPEHMRWRAMGEVAEARIVTHDDGTVTLENRIIPYDDLMYYVRRGSLTQPSVEVIENFANSGKAYQFGMGATDTPASLGTDKFPIQFSASEQQAESQAGEYDLYCQRIALDAKVPIEQVHIFHSPITWADLEFKKQGSKIFDLGRFFRAGSSESTSEQSKEDIEMTKEELQDVLKGFKTELKDELKLEFATQQQPPTVVEAPVNNNTGEGEGTQVTTETVSLEQYNALKQSHDELKEQFDQFMAEDPNPKRPPASGGSNDDEWEGW